MALKATLSSAEFGELADTIKEHYISEGDSYKLETDFVPEDTTALKSALQRERDARKELAKEVNKYKDIDPDKARAAEAKLAEIEQKQLEDTQDYAAAKARIQAEKETEVATVKSELGAKLQTTQEKLQKALIDGELRAQAASQGAIPKSIESFVKLAREFATIDDDLNVTVAAGKGSDIAELVKNLSDTDEFGVFFTADVATGSGAASQKTRTGPKVKKWSESSTQEKAAYASEHGHVAFQKWIRQG